MRLYGAHTIRRPEVRAPRSSCTEYNNLCNDFVDLLAFTPSHHYPNNRSGRNPQTGEAITIEARQILSFKPSGVLKDQINKDIGP
ncbi:MAG: hypothetical protein HGB32_14960 [Geobacteraceae bacterium]|nr:hypothetical protein [Geobacteraceae bacterium]NTW81425.1 hypothetical protein [Geobacteraceae bacterium]